MAGVAKSAQEDAVIETVSGGGNSNALSVVVKFGDLNLARPAGVVTLYRRLAAASTSVCAPFGGRDLARRQKWDTCREHAMSGAIARINNVELTNYYLARTGGKVAIAVAAR
jgi:UrcA family protein